jgi:hypothetical protein
LGTYGYPVKDLMPWTQQLFNNGFKDEKNPNTFDKKAEWDLPPRASAAGTEVRSKCRRGQGRKVSGWDFAKTVGGILWDKGKSWAGEQINNVTEGAKEKWEGVKHGASDLWNGAKEKVSDGWQSAKDTVSGWFGGGKKQVKNNDVGNASHGWEGAKEKEKPKKKASSKSSSTNSGPRKTHCSGRLAMSAAVPDTKCGGACSRPQGHRHHRESGPVVPGARANLEHNCWF